MNHRVTRRYFLSAAATALTTRAADSALPVPSSRQLAWHELESYAFLHFTINTFTDKEWGYGDEDPNLFHPTAFDAGAIVRALKQGGMRAVILTCKHHDGFCLWPTATTKHSVRSSAWNGGKADVVRAISEAAARDGLRFGVYLSPWDRNAASYGTPEYVAMYRAQLRELLTQYGPIFEVWHDGANGGDGYYGGARQKRLIDKRSYYDWPTTWALVRELQPGAVIFSDVGPDIRWVGNEKGFANDPCWATYDPVAPDGGAAAPGYVREKEGGTGHRNGSHWMPAECDVSIRPGWFWHEKENSSVKQPRQLLELYYKSVGRGASFLLNVPPDRRGLLYDADVESLAKFNDLRSSIFDHDLAAGARQSRADDSTIVVELPSPANFNVVRLREDIRLGQRVDAFAIDIFNKEDWEPWSEGSSIGACRIVTGKDVHSQRIRVRVTKYAARPAISSITLHRDNG